MSLYIAPLTRRHMAEEFAKRIRDQVNALGDTPDRLSISHFVDYETEVDVFFLDSRFETDELLDIVWQPNMPEAPVIAEILNAFPEEHKNEEIGTTDL